MTVRVYRSTDAGAPVLTGQVGSLITLLDACLVNGYGSLSITSLTQTGGVATATTATPHLLKTDNPPKILIAGATPSGFNGEFQVTVTGVSTFTFPVSSGLSTPATGSITMSHASSGWTKPFSGTNLAAYKQPAGVSNGLYLRVDDTVTGASRVVGYETMSDVNTGTGLFPTAPQLSGGGYITKSASADATARPWVLVCNGKMFHLIVAVNTDNFTTAVGFSFGDFPSYKSGDTYNTAIICPITGATNSTVFQSYSPTPTSTSVPGMWIARSHTQIGSSVPASKCSDTGKTGQAAMGATPGFDFPSPVDGGVYVAPITMVDNGGAKGVIRGTFPGVWHLLHLKPFSNADVWSPTGDLAGKTFEVVNLTNSCQALLETSDTW